MRKEADRANRGLIVRWSLTPNQFLPFNFLVVMVGKLENDGIITGTFVGEGELTTPRFDEPRLDDTISHKLKWQQ